MSTTCRFLQDSLMVCIHRECRLFGQFGREAGRRPGSGGRGAVREERFAVHGRSGSWSPGYSGRRPALGPRRGRLEIRAHGLRDEPGGCHGSKLLQAQGQREQYICAEATICVCLNIYTKERLPKERGYGRMRSGGSSELWGVIVGCHRLVDDPGLLWMFRVGEIQTRYCFRRTSSALLRHSLVSGMLQSDGSRCRGEACGATCPV